MKILDAKDIFSFSIKVSEEITPKNLLNFIRTSIQNSELPFSKQTFFSFYFNKSMQSYDIIFYNKVIVKTLIEPLIYLYTNDSLSTKIQVYYTKNYFTVIEKGNIIFYKKFNVTVKEDIEIYIKQKYKIENFELFYRSNHEIQHLKKSILDKNILSVNYKEYPLFQQNSFYYFIFFVALSFLLFVSFIYFQSSTTSSIPQKSISKVHLVKIKPHIKPISKTLELFKYIHINKIYIKEIVYVKKKIYTTIMSTNKQNILNFINVYKKNMIIKSLKYNKEKNIYTLEVTVVI